MDSMYKIRDMLYRDLDEYASKNSLSERDIECIHTLTDTIKNICKIDMLEEEKYSHASYGNSYRGNSSRTGSYGGSYDGGSYDDSYRGSSRGGEWEARGAYAGGMGSSRGSYGNGYVSRGRYSRSDVKDHMIGQIEEMMGNADTEEARKALEKCMLTLENC